MGDHVRRLGPRSLWRRRSHGGGREQRDEGASHTVWIDRAGTGCRPSNELSVSLQLARERTAADDPLDLRCDTVA